ncbi:hypothetical protein C8Q76DRAFT_130454 [Earliella scabrosa]|nr:hypothetical protein C8Q76DRAFT_130454 [Earliella scabrosa]
MGENWITVDLDERVCLHGGGKLTEWFWSNPGTIIDALRVPRTKERIDTLISGRVAIQPAPLFRLPPELIDHILTEIVSTSNAHDTRLLLVALTCKALLACAQRHIVRLLTRQHAPLAGHRLICIGDGARTLRDYPIGLLSPVEQDMLLRTARSDADSGVLIPATVIGDDAHAQAEERPASLYAHAAACWWRFSSRKPCLLGCVGLGASTGAGFNTGTRSKPLIGSAALMDLLYRPSTVSRMSKEDFMRLQVLTTPFDTNASQPGWVLCNLSKNEFVLADECSQAGTEWSTDVAAGATAMWHTLLACICWSRTTGTDMASAAGHLRRGRWAGDRFAITTLDKMAPLPEGCAAWQDVTAEVAQVVSDFRASMGPFSGVGHVEH